MEFLVCFICLENNDLFKVKKVIGYTRFRCKLGE